MYFVLEHIDGSTPLFSMIHQHTQSESPTFHGTLSSDGRYEEQQASKLFRLEQLSHFTCLLRFRQILSGLAYLHANHVVHRFFKSSQ